jgi:hypothetical protein
METDILVKKAFRLGIFSSMLALEGHAADYLTKGTYDAV